MKQSEKKGSAIGLDVGTSRIVVARHSEEGFRYESQLNAFVNIPYSRVTENVLVKQNVPHQVEDSRIAVHGNESEKFAELLKIEPRRPMTRGFLNPQEPESLERIKKIITSLCGKAEDSARSLYFSVPAASVGEQDNLTYHEATLRQVLGELGYEAKSITEGLAVVYSELENTNYTGIGVSCGGGLCNVCMAYLSVPVFSFSLPKAGDFIDSSSASVTGELANSVRIIKEESFQFNGHFADKIHQVLGVYYDDVIRVLVSNIKDQIVKCRSLPRLGRPIPIVLSGGSVMPPGFRDRFESILKEAEFPVAVSEIRMAENPLHATARGALMAAMIA
jgi:hypothetical protein